mmetsp:Transcript_18531/g.62092  ORF Transcript_18531/g.62092 Transcript_18531/m.62092 type:complete len:225 (+) Transcript_18531:293-967(+)
MMSDYDVSLVNDSMNDFHVIFDGPKDSAYEGGRWKVHVELPEGYPYKSPSIGFCNRMYHPNVDEMSGSVCLDVINQTWSPMFDLLNIFDTFLPQLLLYPNPADPLNSEAAALLLGHPEEYRKKVKGKAIPRGALPSAPMRMGVAHPRVPGWPLLAQITSRGMRRALASAPTMNRRDNAQAATSRKRTMTCPTSLTARTASDKHAHQPWRCFRTPITTYRAPCHD